MNIESYCANIVRIQTGQLASYETKGRTWMSAIEKTPMSEVCVTVNGLQGDEHTGNHQDPDRAVCCHPLTHYRFWAGYYNKPFPIGMLGENLTLSGVADEDVCIGDIVRCGEVVLQVTQPRTPCWKPAQRAGEPDLVKRVEQTGRRGWLMRVLEPGTLKMGDAYALIERPHPDVPLTYVNRKFHDKEDKETAARLSDVVSIGEEYRRHFLNIVNENR